MTNKRPTIESVIGDPASSYWIKDALNAALARDPVDAANDADVLAQVLNDWAAAVAEAALERLSGDDRPWRR